MKKNTFFIDCRSYFQQEGFLNRLFNRQQWEVTVSYEEVIPTLVLDAVTGEILDIYGPLN